MSTPSETLEEVLRRRVARRAFLKATLIAAPIAGLKGAAVLPNVGDRAAPGSLRFQPIELSAADQVVVSPGYSSQVVVRWGDPLFAGSPASTAKAQSPARQSRQFGYNCDFVGFFPLPRYHSQNSVWGLLAVNHEFTNPELMFPGYVAGSPSLNQVDVEIAAHGLSVVEVLRHSRAGWRYTQGSAFNRRITGETKIQITGPAAGHALMQTSYDPAGVAVRGMLNNCGGGKTPWGTLLTCEENFHQYFANRDSMPDSDPRRAIHARYGLPTDASDRRWELFHSRFDIAAEPNEPFRFGWVVELDPYDAGFVPKKRTALGRTKHEAATVVGAANGKVVVYLGDDERFEYMYKFVSQRRLNPANRAANFDLLDSGTIYVARFHDDGTGEWLPLVPEGLLASWSEPDILVNTRGAADLLGATKMDRPEDIETNPVNGKLYCLMTNNTQRGTAGRPSVDAPNPRAGNRHGHIIEIAEAGNDPTATRFKWEIFMLCGDPDNPADQPTYFAGFDASLVSPISSPDNIAFDREGNLWIATDGQPGTFQKGDGIYAAPVDGDERGYLRQFLSAPVGAEVCGPEFTPDNETLFCAIQHPGEGGNAASPASTWPDGTPPPRPSVIAITKTAAGPKVVGT